MTTIKRHTLLLALSLLALAISARAQTPSIEVSTDTDNVEFSAQGATKRVYVEVYAPSGELVFETNDSDGQSIRWAMTNQKGERVADGVYLATITVVDSLGKKRKRIEQVTVSSPQYNAQAAPAPTGDAPVTTTVNGTAGRLAKFTGASTIGNSVVTEGAGGKIGINTAPAATLQVTGLQPAPLASTGTAAPALLQTSGGLGGNTTVGGGKVAGAGASISLVAGNGGSAPAGSTRGKGGNITLQPGSTGAGAGTAGASGNVLIAPSGVGNVGIGTATPASRLTVNGQLQILGAGNGIKFADGSIQTKATTGTITGTGTANRLAKFTGPNSFGNSSIAEVSGNVGIGTTTPDAKLSIIATGDGRRVLHLGTERAWVFKQLGTGAGTALELTGADLNNNNKHFVINTDGNVGIGTGTTQPQAKLDIRGNVAVQSGNLGIGTTSPQAPLDVRGDVKLGSSGQLYASGGEENLRIVRGVINYSPLGGDISIRAGKGFSVTRVAEGTYDITFDTPFSNIPAITATVSNDDVFPEAFARLSFVSSTNTARIHMINRSDGSYVDRGFHFIAIGLR